MIRNNLIVRKVEILGFLIKTQYKKIKNMTLEEFKKIKNPQTIQEKIDIEWRWSQAKTICKSLGINDEYITYSKEKDKLYIPIE